jgi:hypothetical protein
VTLSVANTPVLLAAITLSAPTNSVNVGDVYTINLVPLSGNGSMTGNVSTFFDVFDFNTGGETSAVPFTSTPGTVTITSASVPEPAALVSGLAGLVVLSGLHGMRRLWRSRCRMG